MGIIPNINRGAWTVIMIMLVVVAVGFGLLITANLSLSGKVVSINQQFETMKAEHEKAAEAANEAIRARDQVYAIMTEKGNAIEKELERCPDFSDLDIPDGLREQIRAQCEREISASGSSAYAH